MSNQILCINGQSHNWLKTGNGFFMWAGTDTGSPSPTNAPFHAEEQCMTCGAVRYVSSIPPIANSMIDIDPEYVKIVDDNFWELLA